MLHYPPIYFFLDLITQIIFGEGYRTLSSSLCSFLQSPVTSSILSPNTLLSTLFSNTLSLCSSLNVSDRPNFTPIQNNWQNYSSVYLNFYIFGLQTGRQKILHRMIESILWLQSALYFFLNRIWFVKVVPKYFNCSILSEELLSIFILWLCPAFWSWDMTMSLVLSTFTASPSS